MTKTANDLSTLPDPPLPFQREAEETWDGAGEGRTREIESIRLALENAAKAAWVAGFNQGIEKARDAAKNHLHRKMGRCNCDHGCAESIADAIRALGVPK